MFVTPVTAGEINDVVLSLKRKSNRTNDLPLNILISCRDMLCDVMAILVTNSFDTGNFPQLLKRVEITPVFKSGDPKLTNDYRPISVLPLLSKIYEKCMYSRLVSHLDRHSVLSVSQYGFRKGRSTADAIYNFTGRIYQALNSNEYLVSTFIDLKKSFQYS